MEQSAGILLVNDDNDFEEFLIMRRYGIWEIPKGHVNEGEELVDTAIRETEEETGVSRGDISFDWGYHYHTCTGYTDKHVYVFVAKSKTRDIVIRKNSDGIYEHHDYKWVNEEELRSKIFYRLKDSVIGVLRDIDYHKRNETWEKQQKETV